MIKTAGKTKMKSSMVGLSKVLQRKLSSPSYSAVRYNCQRSGLNPNETQLEESKKEVDVSESGEVYKNILKTAQEMYGVKKNPFDQRFDVEFEPASPRIPASYNLAGYVNKSPLLQEFVRLGIDMSKWDEDRELVESILKKDFFSDIQPYIRLLTDYGLEPEKLGWFFTKNPRIFLESLDDIQVRFNYLESKRFSPSMIARIISHNPLWLSFKTQEIDEHLGYLQKNFKLTGNEVREIATRCPRLVTKNLWKLEMIKFSIWEEMGFTKEETKSLLLKDPRVFLIPSQTMVERFNYFHNIMKIPHQTVLEYPALFRTRLLRLRPRHEFLEVNNRHQYDKTRPDFVPIDQMIKRDDSFFAVEIAGSSIDVYNEFLKTI
ncbi:transcription termination factor 3, mitochondrial-like isoform X3 [Artemia franciscana]|uniref:transcription termination factor 3, mitochondrial-like isoform X3 n=1 Tax=Artemia franciscana TaxID=6661 RepID=UPI0032DA8DF5